MSTTGLLRECFYEDFYGDFYERVFMAELLREGFYERALRVSFYGRVFTRGLLRESLRENFCQLAWF